MGLDPATRSYRRSDSRRLMKKVGDLRDEVRRLNESQMGNNETVTDRCLLDSPRKRLEELSRLGRVLYICEFFQVGKSEEVGICSRIVELVISRRFWVSD